MKFLDHVRTRAEEIRADREKVNEWLKERVMTRLTDEQRAELAFLEAFDEKAAEAKLRKYGYKPYHWWNAVEWGEINLDGSAYERYVEYRSAHEKHMEYVKERKAAKRQRKQS